MLTEIFNLVDCFSRLIKINLILLASGRRCRVLFSYNPVNEDELALQVDDEIDILAEVEEGWWKGRLGETVSIINLFVNVLIFTKGCQ